MDVSGRTAFVTGGGSGIGLAVARMLRAAGAKVAIADIRDDHLDAAIDELGSRDVAALRLDVTDRAAFAAAADEAEARLGPVSIVVNNAGVYLMSAIDESSYEDWDWVLGVNLQGVVNGVQTFVPRLKAAGQSGHIVNTSSIAGFLVGAIGGIYATANAAVRAMSESLRWSLAPHGIGVSCLCPGLVKTALHRSEEIRPEHLRHRAMYQDPEFLARARALYELGMEPGHVAARVLEGIRRNDLYIFPHHEFRAELREQFEDILAAFPEPTDGGAERVEFEALRRRTYRTAKAAAN